MVGEPMGEPMDRRRQTCNHPGGLSGTQTFRWVALGSGPGHPCIHPRRGSGFKRQVGRTGFWPPLRWSFRCLWWATTA